MTRKRADPRPSDTTIIQPLPPKSTVISVPLWPVDESRAAAAAAGAPEPTVPPAAVERARYTLQFSTGETVSVRGTGLIGRRPLPQPAERFDHLIQITDLGMSVSKSHLEFGQHDGEFWVNDRFSGNGTVVRRAPADAVRCEPGRRYLVARGSRVEIGDQFFVVL
ncbi:FHA domain-containing protein [Cryobacterium sp. SO2]|uniref:FHA domain-containing protein n=1 Tax=Cryobacterium sp. SO2 TaxID=1897060 RepID=UPI00223E66A8|nr:FHA domain-containing protein [Cryobacterium sp. SO2]WEO78352.1 FHA domain-containing protein [Cryobacterium sp. SO2]